MKILMTATHPGVQGPIPSLVEDLAGALRGLGCSVDLAPWGLRKENENLFWKVLGRAWDLIVLVWSAARSRPDVLYVHTSHTWASLTRDIPLLLLAKPFARRLVLEVHGSEIGLVLDPQARLFRLASLWLVRLADEILLLSTEEEQQWTRLCPRSRFRVIDYAFIPLAERCKLEAEAARAAPSSEKPVILFVGRLIREKGPFDVLEALEVVRQKHDCHAIFAGAGRERRRLMEAAEQRGLTGAVTFASYLQKPALLAAYRSAKALVLPTWHAEGFPVVVLEAMAEGLPIITTRIRGVRDHLEENVNALFVEPRDPASLARAIAQLLENPALVEKMARANREKAREFHPKRVVPRYLEILNQDMESIMPASDAVALFSSKVAQFDARYVECQDFRERFAIWSKLIEKYSRNDYNVLDVGCGTGIFTLFAAVHNRDALGIDGSREMIQCCEQKKAAFGRNNASFRCCRIEELPALQLEPADLLLCSSVLEYVDDLCSCFEILMAMLRPGGTS